MTENSKSVLVITRDAAVSEVVGAALSGIRGLQISNETDSLATMNGRAVKLAAHKDLIIFETSNDEQADLAAVKALAAARDAGTVLLALADQNITLSRVRALNDAGVDEVLPTPLCSAEIRGPLSRLAQTPQTGLFQTGRQPGRIIAVAQARGGIGSTTVAVNLADALTLGRKRGRKKTAKRAVALVDLDLQFGSVGAFLDLGEQDAMHRLALDGIMPDATFLGQAMTELPNGLSVLPAPSKFVPLDALQADQVTAILDLLQRENDFVVVDLPHALVPWIEPVLRRADELVIVTDTTVPAVRHCRRLIDFLTADNPALQVRLVVNHEKKAWFGSGLQKEAARALDRKLDYWLPHDPRAARASVDQGKTLARVAPRSRLSREMRRLAIAVGANSNSASTETRPAR